MHDEETIHKANIMGELGIAYYRKGKHSKAMRIFKEIINMLEDSSHWATSRTLAATLNQIGNIYQQYKRDYSCAMKFYSLAMRIFETINEPLGRAVCLTNLGGCALDLGDFESALEYQKRSLNIERKLERPQGIANSLNWIGRIYHMQKDHAKAMEAFTESVRICRELGDTWNEASVTGNIGLLAQEMENWRGATIHFARVINLLSSTESPMRALAINHLDKLRVQCGDDLIDEWIAEA